jgi:ABC-type multidrug transport system fused ATPase/permease subunit
MNAVDVTSDSDAVRERTSDLARPTKVRFEHLKRSFRRLAPLLGSRRGPILWIAICALGAGLAEAAVLALVAFIASAMSGTGDEPAIALGPSAFSSHVPLLLLLAGILAVVRFLLQLVLARLPARLSGGAQSRLRSELYAAFLDASWPTKARDREGSLQELMGMQVSQAGNGVLQVANAFSSALMFGALVVSALLLNAMVAAAIIATVASLFAILRPLSRRVRRGAAATSAALIAQASSIAESVRMAAEMQVFGATGADRSRITRFVDAVEISYVRARSLSRIVPALYEGAVITIVVAGLGVMYGIGTTRMAVLGAVVLLLVRAASYGQQLQAAYQNFGESLPYLDRVTAAIEKYRSGRRQTGHLRIDSVKRLSFDSVTFGYVPETPVLRDITFSIESGEAVGIVGPTGAGKSTLVQLLLRLMEPTAGSYSVNGLSASEILDESWHQKVAYLPQDPHLLNASVAENIRFFRNELDDKVIERAARLAHIHDEVLRLHDGYGTIVGQRADAVSGGQRQRLCLARALAGDPEVLILDEPTSALDPHSERLIQGTLEALHGRLTLIVVAHRLTTLTLCDRVMVTRAGQLEAFAPATVLYASNEFYRRAVDLAATAGSAL